MKKATGLGDPMVFSASDKKNGGILIIKEDFVSDKTSVSDTDFICGYHITNHGVLSICPFDFSVISSRQEFTKSYIFSKKMAQYHKACNPRHAQKSAHHKGDGIDAYGKAQPAQKKQQGRAKNPRKQKAKKSLQRLCQSHQYHNHQTGDDHGG